MGGRAAGIAMERCGPLWVTMGQGPRFGGGCGSLCVAMGQGPHFGGHCGSLWVAVGQGLYSGCPWGALWGAVGQGLYSLGLCGALWVAVGPRSDAALQDELHVLESLELPAADGRLLLELADFRRWGGSALIVDL